MSAKSKCLQLTYFPLCAAPEMPSLLTKQLPLPPGFVVHTAVIRHHDHKFNMFISCKGIFVYTNFSNTNIRRNYIKQNC